MPEIAFLPDLSGAYPLTEQQIADYRRDGHILLPGVCSPAEIAAYGPIITDAATRFNYETRPIAERDTFGKAFLIIGGIWYRDAEMAKFTLARRFAQIAAELMGVAGTRLYHDVAINKEPGGGPTPWHQDAYYWPMETPHTVTMWMPLVDITYEMGGLDFASGSQKHGYLGEGISDESSEFYDRIIAEKNFPVVSPAAAAGGMKAGDATFHSGWTLHSAPNNPTNQARRIITIVYYEEGAYTYKEMGNPHREADFKAYMPGVTPGALAASERNPVVYKK